MKSQFHDNDEKSRRLFRVEEQLKRILAEILAGGINDPRVGMVDITGVKVTPDLREARFYIRVVGGEDELESTMVGLKSARGYIQRQLGRSLNIKYTPVISFFPDKSVDRVEKIERIIEKIKREELKEEDNESPPASD